MRKIFDAYREVKQCLDYLEPYQKFMQLPEIGQESEQLQQYLLLKISNPTE